MAAKEHQPPLTVDEQIENLKELNLIIEDKSSAREILNSVSLAGFCFSN